jgi:hypothetical protein
MERIFSHPVFILGRNEDHNERMVSASASKMARTRCNAKIKGMMHSQTP